MIAILIYFIILFLIQNSISNLCPFFFDLQIKNFVFITFYSVSTYNFDSGYENLWNLIFLALKFSLIRDLNYFCIEFFEFFNIYNLLVTYLAYFHCFQSSRFFYFLSKTLLNLLFVFQIFLNDNYSHLKVFWFWFNLRMQN